MKIPFVLMGLGIGIASCGSAFALQPMAFPMRSQSAAQQSIDTAMCYATANQQTGVSMARLSQAPEKPKVVKAGAVKQVAVADPLPKGMAPGPAAPSVSNAPAMPDTPAAASMVQVSLATGKAGKPAVAPASSPDMPMLPALPPPESPMVSYWTSYSGCMTGKGYMVK